MLGMKTLAETDSKFNGHIKVVRSWGLGTYIQADGLTQSGGIVEDFWKQTLRHLKKENIKSVIIFGLGGGTIVKIVKKYWPGAKITGVDIDPQMIELGKKYLNFDARGVEIKVGDASRFTDKAFDLAIVDLYNGDNFPAKFASSVFIKALTKNRIVIFNRLYYKRKKDEALEFGNKLKKFFDRVEYFYPITNVMFICYP